MVFSCPRCGRASRSPDDVREGYCGACHDWTGLVARPEDMTERELALYRELGIMPAENFSGALIVEVRMRAAVSVGGQAPELPPEPGSDAMEWSPGDGELR